MLEITKSLRPKSLIPPYPNYHIGEYFEEFFFTRFVNEYKNIEINGFKYIPIFWTNCYTNKVFASSNYEIQKVLDLLDDNEKYFTISQHDDCVNEKLPKNTLIFSMGGNKTGKNITPIPLICSPLTSTNVQKNIKISFVGSLTHPIRNKLYNFYKNDEDFVFHTKNWEIKSDISDIEKFKNITNRSFFTLSPRGYGKTSFRLYESLQLNSTPIYVSDEHWLPWQDEIDWSEFCVLIDEKDMSNIKNIVNSKDHELMNKYKNKIYNEYFTYEGVYYNIIKRLKLW